MKETESDAMFRGKRLDNGKWVEGYYAKFGTADYILSGKMKKTGHRDEYNIICYQPEKYGIFPDSKSQYIGLYDKNGKRVFSGDIVKLNDGTDELYVVQKECDTPGGYWAETGYILQHIGWSDYLHFTDTIDDWDNECQIFIVGNIYDNKEMLKGNKK